MCPDVAAPDATTCAASVCAPARANIVNAATSPYSICIFQLPLPLPLPIPFCICRCLFTVKAQPSVTHKAPQGRSRAGQGKEFQQHSCEAFATIST